MRAASPFYTVAPNNASILPLTMQLSVLTNRFVINLKSLGTAGSELSQSSSSGRHRSRLSALDFCVQSSFLGNIGEDLQDDYDTGSGDNDQETDSMSANVQDSPETELEKKSTAFGSPAPHPLDINVSAPSTKDRCARRSLNTGWLNSGGRIRAPADRRRHRKARLQ